MVPIDTNIESLTSLIQGLKGEQGSIQVVGRALRPEEKQRLMRLAIAINHLEKGRDILFSKLPDSRFLPGLTLPPLDESQARLPLKDGRYQGGNGRYYIDLRIDESVSGVISADIFANDIGERIYLASIRTTPGKQISTLSVSWSIGGQDELGKKVIGKLSLVAQIDDPQQIVGQMHFDSPLQGLPGRTNINFAARWTSKYLRTIGLEMEIEEGVDSAKPFDFNGRSVTIKSCFEDAGFEVTAVGEIDRLPKPANPSGWGTAEIIVLRADLNKAMEEFGQASLKRRAWELHYLMLSQATRSRLNGIMFDSTRKFPRQGVAVFTEAIRKNYGVWADRKLIQTSVHELGHALNLAHRFERVVGRADSISFMNYDWRYKGSNHSDQYWQDFAFTFDSDELEFLLHGPEPAVSPGGEPFHSVSYWAEGGGGYSPYYPERPLTGYQLNLKPPLGGPVFAFGQPIFLEIELNNVSGPRLSLSPNLLDPKAGMLQVMISRITGRTNDSSQEADLFMPIMQRCFDESPSNQIDFKPGSVMRNNLNLAYGSSGFAFAEPGQYEVRAVFGLVSKDKQEYVAFSNALQLRVATPQSMDEERDALTLFRDDVGSFFALGGAANLESARNALEEINDRRQGKGKKIKDPIVANIVRCKGIDAGRSYIRLKDGDFKIVSGDRAYASASLMALDARALQAFDAHTAENTQKLAEKHGNAAKS